MPSEFETPLYCPQCDYNLTGLTRTLCPECGREFDWDTLRREQAAPTIAFERARGWRKIGGFLVTWTTVLFTPWIFARQVGQRVSLPASLVFAAICFVGPAASCASQYSPGGFTNELAITISWLLACAAQITVQAVGLSLIDRQIASPFGTRFRFWIAVGGYTSAVVITEILGFPPMIEVAIHKFPEFVSDGWTAWRAPGSASPEVPIQFHMAGPIQWAQLLLWLVGPLCVLWTRQKDHEQGNFQKGLRLLGVLLLLLLIFGLVETYVATSIYFGIENLLPD